MAVGPVLLIGTLLLAAGCGGGPVRHDDGHGPLSMRQGGGGQISMVVEGDPPWYASFGLQIPCMLSAGTQAEITGVSYRAGTVRPNTVAFIYRDVVNEDPEEVMPLIAPGRVPDYLDAEWDGPSTERLLAGEYHDKRHRTGSLPEVGCGHGS